MGRYDRQVSIPSIGEAGQQKLHGSKVLVIGAGGLGSPVLYYLCAAGIGTLGIADYDTVSESNLNRQILHTTPDIHSNKTASAREKLHALNPASSIITHDTMLDESNISDIVTSYDIIVDCVDSIYTRLLVGRACMDNGKMLVEGGIESFCGFVMSYRPGAACYGCLVGQKASTEKKIPVLGATAGVIGSIQATECIKLLLSIGEPLLNRVLYIDLLHHDYQTIEIQADAGCKICGYHE